MLVLTRKVGESIHIGDGIVVTVVDVDSKNCRIGIQAPASVSVYRSEVYTRIQEENRKALRTAQPDLGAMAQLFRKRDDESKPG